MKMPLIILAIFFGFVAKSQTNRFIYELKSREDSTKEFTTNNMVLDINPKSIKFYDEDFLKYDSINKNNKEGYSSRTSSKTDQIIVRKPGSNQNTWYRDFKDYFVITSNDQLNWKLDSETRKYNNYQLQKATTNFGGRAWTAWFCKDINIPEGPYKFRGLPGLIFILEDSEKDFVYQLVQNKKLNYEQVTTDFVETHYGNKALPTTNENYNKYVVDFYENPLRDMIAAMQNGKSISFKNEKVTTMDELNQKKAAIQKVIKDRFVYLERDKAPKFN
ncbi:GLPGLI family protein [Soonwooa sp.]|uniref:GLPGLI family protein n=1 Tax=Soonwooa sp. TaxID=1938592 RepID=UPI0026107676|nr:GLPGLI family protein [Soonwooa sp.]